MNQDYIEYMHPGTFFAESSEAPVATRALPATIPARVTGYRFFSRTESTASGEKLSGKARDYSPWTYFGTEYTVEQLAAAHGIDSILYGNIARNGYERAVKTSWGNWYPLNPGDTVTAQAAETPKEGDQQ